MTANLAAWPAVTGGRDTARVGRATVFGGSSVSLAYAAHVAGGGYHPPWLLIAVAVGLAARVAYGLAGTERGPLALAAGLGVAQLTLHAGFAVATSSPAAHVGAHHHAALLPSGAMTAAHVLAAALTALLLRGAEHRTWNTARLRLALRGAVDAVRATARAGRRQVSLLVALIAGRGGRQAGGALAGAPRAGVPWLAAADTSTWRAAIGSDRSGRRRGPPVAVVPTVTTTQLLGSQLHRSQLTDHS